MARDRNASGNSSIASSPDVPLSSTELFCSNGNTVAKQQGILKIVENPSAHSITIKIPKIYCKIKKWSLRSRSRSSIEDKRCISTNVYKKIGKIFVS